MSLPDNLKETYDALKRLGGWQINPCIANIIGRQHNTCSKNLSFLMKRGLVESRRVVKDGKKTSQSEYCIASIEGVNSQNNFTPTKRQGTGSSVAQVSSPCPKCGSYYRLNEDTCNICGKEDSK